MCPCISFGIDFKMPASSHISPALLLFPSLLFFPSSSSFPVAMSISLRPTQNHMTIPFFYPRRPHPTTFSKVEYPLLLSKSTLTTTHNSDRFSPQRKPESICVTLSSPPPYPSTYRFWATFPEDKPRSAYRQS